MYAFLGCHIVLNIVRLLLLSLLSQAPTAQKVELLHFWESRGGQPDVHSMKRNEKGVWSFHRPGDWKNTCVHSDSALPQNLLQQTRQATMAASLLR